jgi:hypothetical protein
VASIVASFRLENAAMSHRRLVWLGLTTLLLIGGAETAEAGWLNLPFLSAPAPVSSNTPDEGVTPKSHSTEHKHHKRTLAVIAPVATVRPHAPNAVPAAADASVVSDALPPKIVAPDRSPTVADPVKAISTKLNDLPIQPLE